MKTKKCLALVAVVMAVMMTVDVAAQDGNFYVGVENLTDISTEGMEIGEAQEYWTGDNACDDELQSDLTVSGDDYSDGAIAEAIYSNSGALSAAKMSKTTIANYLSGIYNKSFNLLAVAPNTSAPYSAGAVSPEHLQYGLASVNLMRKIAGLPIVSLDDTYNTYAQHGSVLLGAWGQQYGYLSLNHTPSCAPGMDSSFYDLGYRGTSQGNIACGYPASYYNIPLFTVGYMQDEDPGNASRVGHRRWILNPKMGKTGLGYAINSLNHAYSALYAFDSSAPLPDYDFIAWPSSGNFPNNLMSAKEPWSITLNPTKFKTSSAYLNTSSISLTVQAPNGVSKTFSPSEESDACLNNYGSSYFTINYGGYGVSNCIIFRPGTDLFGSRALNGTYTVTVNGLRDSVGAPVSLYYTVDFFNPDEYRTGDADISSINNKMDEAALEGFVNRLYSKCLNRHADSEGMIYWKDELRSGKQSGAGVAAGFFFSTEYLNKNTSDDEFIENLYEVMLGRYSDPDGKADWSNRLKNGVSREAVYCGFAMSKEFGDICSSYGINRGDFKLTQPRDVNQGVTMFVARLYTKALGRHYELEGLNTWCQRINSGEWSIDLVSTNGFFGSVEFRSHNYSNSEYIKILYRTFLDREYDPVGYEYWMNRMANGATREDVLLGFSHSEEFGKIKKLYGVE